MVTESKPRGRLLPHNNGNHSVDGSTSKFRRKEKQRQQWDQFENKKCPVENITWPPFGFPPLHLQGESKRRTCNKLIHVQACSGSLCSLRLNHHCAVASPALNNFLLREVLGPQRLHMRKKLSEGGGQRKKTKKVNVWEREVGGLSSEACQVL